MRAKRYQSTQRHILVGRADEEHLVTAMINVKRQYSRYGQRRIAVLLRYAGWQLNNKLVERLKRGEGHKVPMKQNK